MIVSTVLNAADNRDKRITTRRSWEPARKLSVFVSLGGRRTRDLPTPQSYCRGIPYVHWISVASHCPVDSAFGAENQHMVVAEREVLPTVTIYLFFRCTRWPLCPSLGDCGLVNVSKFDSLPRRFLTVLTPRSSKIPPPVPNVNVNSDPPSFPVSLVPHPMLRGGCPHLRPRPPLPYQAVTANSVFRVSARSPATCGRSCCDSAHLVVGAVFSHQGWRQQQEDRRRLLGELHRR